MPDLLLHFLNNPLALLMLIIVAGLALGRIEIGGLSLGSSGVLFAALVAGHFHAAHADQVAGLPPLVSTFGVVLFVYAVGLQAGPRFFKTFRSQGRLFVMIALATLLAGAATTFACAWLFGLKPAIAAGIYAGALTTTPGLAAALEALNDPAVSVGYGVAYPFGVAGVVVFVQLMPRLLGIDLKQESEAAEREVRGPKIKAVWFELNNPNCAGKTIAELNLAGLTNAVFSRIERAGEMMPGLDDARLEVGDRVKVAATPDDRRLLATILGPELADDHVDETRGNLMAREVFLTSHSRTGRTIGEMQLKERYGLVVTRLWRQEIEFLPHAGTQLDFGDLVRVVGPRESVEKFVADFGLREKRLEETNFLPLILGMLLGIIAGMFPLRLFGFEFALGMAGGPLFVALICGHFGHIGPFSIRVPGAARIFTRELGLMLFLAGAGMKAGEGLIPILREQGTVLVIAALLVTIVPMGVAFAITRLAKVRVVSSLGLICGAMTSTPALGALTASCDSEAPALSYATVYPAALISVTIISQLLAMLMLRVFGAG